MKTRIKYLIAIIFAAPILAFGTSALIYANQVAAESSTSSDTKTPVVKPAEPTVTNNTEHDPSVDPKGILDRVNQHEAELKTKLSTLDMLKIKSKCKVEQVGNISSLSGRVKGIETSRNEAYTNLQSKLNELEIKIKTKGIDTTKLDAEVIVLKSKIDKFKIDIAAYKQAVSDLKNIDCVANPTGFKAALDATRTMHDNLAKEGVDIKTYVNDTIKTTLKDIRTQLAASDTKTGSTN